MSRRSIAIVPNTVLRRVALSALLCLIFLLVSCGRPSHTASQTTSSSARSAQQTPPSSEKPAGQPQAAIALAPQPAEQAQGLRQGAGQPLEQIQPPATAGQPPDRLLASGHSAAITAVAFTPDRRLAATGGDDKTVRIWDLATASEQRVLAGHSGRIAALAFSPDGTRLASAGEDGIRVWDPATGNSLYAFALPSKWAEQVAFSSDGQTLAASAGADDEGGYSYIEVHDAATGARIRGITLDWNNATPVLITPDGRLLSSGGAGEDGEYVSTKVWELRTGRELQTLPVLFSAFSADGHWGASLEYRQGTQIHLWDIAAGRRVRTLSLPGTRVSRVAFTPDGARILAVAQDAQNHSEIRFFEVAAGRELQSLPISAANSVAGLSADGKWLAASSGSSVNIWDVAAAREVETLAGQLVAQDLAFSPDGRLLITGGTGGGAAFGIWDVASGKLIRTVSGEAQSVIISADGRWLAANPKGSLEIWETKTWSRVAPSAPAGRFVWWMGFAAAPVTPGDISAAGVRWWQVGAGAEASSLWGTTFPAALSPDGKILATAALREPAASAYDRPNVGIWDVATGRLLQTFAAHEVGVSSIAFSPDGKWLATSGQDSRLDPAHLGASLAAMKHSTKLWDTATWQARVSMPFVGAGGGLPSFSPDGRMLAISSQNSVTLYEAPGGRAIKTLSGTGGGSVRFSPDGRWLARGGGNGIALWNLAGLNK